MIVFVQMRSALPDAFILTATVAPSQNPSLRLSASPPSRSRSETYLGRA